MPNESQASQRRSVRDNNEGRVNPGASHNDRRRSERSRASSPRGASRHNRSRGWHRRGSRQTESLTRLYRHIESYHSRSRQRSLDYNITKRRNQEHPPPS